MRQHLAKLIWAQALAGCSLIYNPSNLPTNSDGGVDTPIADVNPALLRLDMVKSPDLFEGAGQSGSAPQLLVVYGMHILPDATVGVAPTTLNNNVTLQTDPATIAKDGNSFATLVRAGYMDMVNEAAGPIELTITVSQTGADPKTIKWALKPLDELTQTGMQAAPPVGKLFSRVNVAGDIDFNPGATRAIIRAVGSITIANRVSADADNMTRAAGAGGCGGGAGNADGQCFGGGKAGGGGAGFATAGGDAVGAVNTGGAVSGDELIKVYEGANDEMNRSAGGGGGGGAGGGGGGTIELTAGGDVAARIFRANAADGQGGLTGGGGGAGGVVLVRAGGTLTHPMTLNVAGGGGGAGTLGGNGGAGSIGRWRVDAAVITGNPPTAGATTPPPRRGPMIVRPANPIYKINNPMLMVAGKSGDSITLITVYPDGAGSDSKTLVMTSDAFPVQPPNLRIGLNTVCVVVPGGNFANDEAKNCIEVAFLP